ncbi:MAG: FAD-dependent oxidoreductase [Geminicoccaceae bacterium]
MAEALTPDLCIIGGGSAGLALAAGAVQMGASVVLCESGAMGGDCLNYGCIPSKSLIAAAAVAGAQRRSGRFGIAGIEPVVDYDAVQAHVREVIETIAPHDSVERFTKLGVRVIEARAKFSGPREVVAGDQRIRARRFVIATGSHPILPKVPGLGEFAYLTNENVFDLRVRPDHLLVLGGGPIGCELAQAFRRLGSRVTLIEMDQILPRDDPELTDVVRRQFVSEGIELLENMAVVEAEPGPVLVLADGRRLEGTHVLVGAGRYVETKGLGLEAAGIECTDRGIKVDAGLRTTNPRVFAIGDAAGGLQFTHVAAYHAGIVLRRALFRLPAKASNRAIPWVTYTDPELATVGLSEAAARSRGVRHEVVRWTMDANDRAQAERRTEGLVKAVIGKGGRVLGATIVASGAGELILPWVMAVEQRMKIGALASVVAPYPTLSEASKRAAGQYFVPRLFSPFTRRIVRFLARFG